MIFNYITTNKISKKRYVGSHEGGFTDSYLGSGIALKKAIKKHGKENFQRDVLNVVTTKEEAFNNEKFLIEMYKTLAPAGYNLSKTGGYFCTNIGELNYTSKAVLQYTNRGVFMKRWGSIADVGRQTKINASAISACFIRGSYTCGGYIWIIEDELIKGKTINKIMGLIKRRENAPHHFSKTVIQYSTKGEYIKEWEGGSFVQKKLGILQSDISACIRDKLKTAGGYIWVLRDKSKEIEAINKEVKQMVYNGKYKPLSARIPILQYTLDGEFLKELDGIIAAQDELGITNRKESGISSCIHGKIWTAHGFIWRRRKKGVTIKEIHEEVKGVVEARREAGHPNGKPVRQYSKDGIFIKEWSSTVRAAVGTGILRTSINNCVRGTTNTAGGYKWELKEKSLK